MKSTWIWHYCATNFEIKYVAFYEIKNGEIAGMLNDVAYQSNTQEFWNKAIPSEFAKGGVICSSAMEVSSSSSSNLPTSHSKSVTSPTAANATGRSKSETQSEPVDFSSNPPLSSLSAAAAARSSGFADRKSLY